jgi:hypothetical protein
MEKDVIDLTICADKFLLYQYWKSFWKDDENVDILKCSPEEVLKDLSKWTEEAQHSFLLTFQNYLMGKRHELIFPQSFASIILPFVSSPGLLHYAVCWLLNCLRWLRRRGVKPITFDCTEIIIRIPKFPFAYQYKVMGLLMRLGSEQSHIIISTAKTLLSDPLCQRVLSDLVSEQPIPFRKRDTLGLVVLSDRPNVQIFLMRLVIFALEITLDEVDPIEFVNLLTLVPWEPWQYSVALLALFNDHEGLIYKFLLLFLKVEGRLSWLVSPLQEHICSAILYRDMIYRANYDANIVKRSILENVRALEYYYKVYEMATDGLLFNSKVFFDPEIVQFHDELLLLLKVDPSLVPISRYLEKLARLNP